MYILSSVLLALLAALQCAQGWQLWTHEDEGPGPRAGHSLLLFNETVYLFGGRGNEIKVIHDPKTYKIAKVNGTLYFETYNQKHVKDCFDADGNPIDADQATPEQYHACYDIEIGTYRNDIWAYDLRCDRNGDYGCSDGTGWTEIYPHAPMGGCKVYKEQEVCTHPHERWDQSAAVLERPAYGMNNSGMLLVFGGYARMCEDYCSDMWSFDITGCGANSTYCGWTKVASLGREGPGKRWRSATAYDSKRWVIFGGHRLWHGFALENSLKNWWIDETRYPLGGYLDDMWVFTLNTNLTGYDPLYGDTDMDIGISERFGEEPDGSRREIILGEPVETAVGTWRQVLPRERCYKSPGDNWDARNDILCALEWPTPRASAAIVLYEEGLYLHGGYTTPFPYPHMLGRGAGPGVGSLASDSRSPYPTHPYYLHDMWHFSFLSGTWRQVELMSDVMPRARRGHSLVVAGASLLLFGGYALNVFSSDLWIFNITNNLWLEKTYFPHPLYPENCTSDVLYDENGKESLIIGQYSVVGEPTRFTTTDGMYGRAPEAVFVEQPRRQAAGWDGCRDRSDGRDDLPSQLQYLVPSQRAAHASVWSDEFGMMLMYGGESLLREENPSAAITHLTLAVGDLWAWHRDSCPKNCSRHGTCWYGHCYCEDGWYGIDCSNSTCPGDYCYYDTDRHVQHCQHCCSSPYVHADDDIYISNMRKVPCDADHHGLSHGICNGFGQCQCAPPFVGDDCSIRDCPNNCTGNGWCSVEYPVSRCMCSPPWAGTDCSIQLCLNNCSYPNGECVDGACQCTTLASPYNRSQIFSKYQGDDCSWLIPFAGVLGGAVHPATVALLAAAVAVLHTLWAAVGT